MFDCQCQRCRCETRELIRNGNFEVRSSEPNHPFQFWEEVFPSFARVTSDPALTNIAYEGFAAARFNSQNTMEELDKSVALQQTVTATPGCLYRLSFAENLLIKGNGMAAAIPILTAKVIYIDNYGNAVDLIVVPILKFDQNRDPDRGYVYHEATADVPVPCSVSELIVRFEYFENSSIGSAWLLDSVSLRAVCPTSVCCQCDVCNKVC
ncbi:MAG TPA: hypothetical protein PLM20_06425 [Syntrophomonadaceae bacterium]|nr:hypothetical protein [Syntrophomonadaceae bacterium]